MDYLTGSNSAVVPPGVGVLLKSVPADYNIGNGNGAISLIVNPSANGCTS